MNLATLSKVKSCQKRSFETRADLQKRLNAVVEKDLVEGSHFTVNKMHLLNHDGPTIPRFGSLPQWSTDVAEVNQNAVEGRMEGQ